MIPTCDKCDGEANTLYRHGDVLVCAKCLEDLNPRDAVLNLLENTVTLLEEMRAKGGTLDKFGMATVSVAVQAAIKYVEREAAPEPPVASGPGAAATVADELYRRGEIDPHDWDSGAGEAPPRAEEADP